MQVRIKHQNSLSMGHPSGNEDVAFARRDNWHYSPGLGRPEGRINVPQEEQRVQHDGACDGGLEPRG
jgi:hypothetical protein